MLQCISYGEVYQQLFLWYLSGVCSPGVFQEDTRLSSLDQVGGVGGATSLQGAVALGPLVSPDI